MEIRKIKYISFLINVESLLHVGGSCDGGVNACLWCTFGEGGKASKFLGYVLGEIVVN
jgi:hypothetical protein